MLYAIVVFFVDFLFIYNNNLLSKKEGQWLLGEVCSNTRCRSNVPMARPPFISSSDVQLLEYSRHVGSLILFLL